MPRQTFDQELQHIQEEIIALGDKVETALRQSVEALKEGDLERAQQLVAGDCAVNEKRFHIEGEALILIATRQPTAGDLRTIAAVIEIATELERIGDYAKGIARIVLMIGHEPLLKPLIDIPLMAEKGIGMLHRALQAFIQRDLAAARAIPQEDAEVDTLYNRVYHDLLERIVADPNNIDRATHLLWVAHNLERTADRVTNLCERVIFTITGEMRELDVQEEGETGTE